MSQWEYEAGRKACLENMAVGDFSNGGVPEAKLKTQVQRDYWMNWAKAELAKLAPEHDALCECNECEGGPSYQSQD